ncbi:MAG: sensor histidine kinase [Ginsengibacter sp.]
MTKQFFIVLLKLLFGTMIVFSQTKKTDSLLLILKNSKPDTNKVNTLNALSEELKNSNPDSAIYFANQAMAFAIQLNHKMGIADAKLNTARASANLGQTEEGLKNCNDALKLYDQLSGIRTNVDQSRVMQQESNAYNTKGIIYLMQGNYPEALTHLFSALSIREKTRDKKGIADTENNIGIIYLYQRNFPECLKHYLISLNIRIKLGDKRGAAGSYHNIGGVYMDQGNYSKALQNYGESLKFAKQAGDRGTMANIYSNTGFIEAKQGKYDDAVRHLRSAIKILKETGNQDGLVAAYTNIGQTFIRQKRYTEASRYLNQALSHAKEMNGLLRMQEIYSELTILDSAQGNFKQAFEHYKLFVYYRDSMFNSENSKKIMQSQMQFDFDKKESFAKAEQNKKDILIISELSNHKMIRNFSFAGIGIVLFFSGFGLYRYHQNKQLSKQLALSLTTLKQAQVLLIKTEKEKEAENIRVQISRDIHDEVGATLSGIALFSEIARQKIKHHQDMSVQGYLENITANSREMIEKMSDIVWTINPRNDSFERLISKLQSFAINLCAGKGIKLHLNIEESIHRYSPDMQVRKNLYLIMKEAINNAVKYSGAINIYVSLKCRNDEIHVTVKDDGNGFDAAVTTEGNGLNNMRARVRELHSKLTIESQKGKGTLVKLQMRFHPNGGQTEVG